LHPFAQIDPKHPVLIAGPTASGKSALAMDIARRFDSVIINADALQVYDCWRVLTARPGVEDTENVAHALYGTVGRTQEYSVGHWLRDVARILKITDRHAIIVGGTGLYLSSIVNGLADIPKVSHEVRKTCDTRFQLHGLAALIKDLERVDRATLAGIDRQNPARVRRAWEVYHGTGYGLAYWHKNQSKPLIMADKANLFVVEAPKDWLNTRIATRLNNMIAGGALDECRAALSNWQPDLPSSQAIGAKSLISYLNGEMTLDAATAAAALATRQYAKRQRSWFRARMVNWQTVNLSTDPSG